MAGWKVYKYAASVYTAIPASDITITLSIESVNTANMTVTPSSGGIVLATNDTIVIKYDDDVSETIAFEGFVDTVQQENLAQYRVVVAEKGNELQNVYVEDDVTGFLVEITNPSSTKTMGEYVDVLLNKGETNDTGWVDNSPAANQALTTIITTSPPTTIPPMLFSYISCFEALNAFIGDDCGLKYRFEYDHSAGTKYVVYGTVGDYASSYKLSTASATDITSDVIKFNSVEDNFDYNIDRVVVIGLTETNGTPQYSGSATVGAPATPPRSLLYQFTDLTSNNEADVIAASILSQRNSANQRYEIILPTGYTGFREGDWITYDSTNYCIFDISYSQSETTFGVQGNKIGTQEVYSGHKVVSNSGAFTGTQANYDGGEQLMGSGSYNGSFTRSTLYALDVGAANIGNFDEGTPFRVASSGSLPTGLADNMVYYAKNVNPAGLIDVTYTPNGTDYVTTSDAGSGTHTIYVAYPCKWTININNVSNIGDYNLYLNVDKYKSSTQSDRAAAALTVNSSSLPSNALSTMFSTNVTDQTMSSSTYYYFPDSFGLSTSKVGGYQFGLINFNILINNPYSSDNIFYLKLQSSSDGGSTWINESDEEFVTLASSTLNYSTTMPFDGTTSSSTMDYRIRMYNTSGVVTYSRGWSITGSVFGRHVHTTTEPNADTGHDTTMTDDQFGIALPSKMYVWLYNSSYPQGTLLYSKTSSIIVETLSIGEISSSLVSGENIVVVTGDGIGSFRLSADYLSYGV